MPATVPVELRHSAPVGDPEPVLAVLARQVLDSGDHQPADAATSLGTSDDHPQQPRARSLARGARARRRGPRSVTAPIAWPSRSIATKVMGRPSRPASRAVDSIHGPGVPTHPAARQRSTPTSARVLDDPRAARETARGRSPIARNRRPPLVVDVRRSRPGRAGSSRGRGPGHRPSAASRDVATRTIGRAPSTGVGRGRHSHGAPLEADGRTSGGSRRGSRTRRTGSQHRGEAGHQRHPVTDLGSLTSVSSGSKASVSSESSGRPTASARPAAESIPTGPRKLCGSRSTRPYPRGGGGRRVPGRGREGQELTPTPRRSGRARSQKVARTPRSLERSPTRELFTSPGLHLPHRDIDPHAHQYRRARHPARPLGQMFLPREERATVRG